MLVDIVYMCIDEYVMINNNGIDCFYTKYDVSIGGHNIFNHVSYDEIDITPMLSNYGYQPLSEEYLFFRARNSIEPVAGCPDQ